MRNPRGAVEFLLVAASCSTAQKVALNDCMMSRRSYQPRCLFVALISAWAVAVFVPSAIFALAGLSPLAAGHGLLEGTWRVADQVAPFAKLGYAAAFLALVLVSRRASIPRRWVILLDIILACVAMLLVLALLPSAWSRGFGVGLVGQRFSTVPTIIYMLGAVLSGISFAVAETRCAKAA